MYRMNRELIPEGCDVVDFYHFNERREPVLFFTMNERWEGVITPKGEALWEYSTLATGIYRHRMEGKMPLVFGSLQKAEAFVLGAYTAIIQLEKEKANV